MAIFRITDLRTSELAQPPTLDSFIPCVQSGVTKQISVLQIKQYLGDGTVRSVTAGQGLISDPTPITNSGTISFSCPGLMAIYAGENDPIGWLICDGRSLPVDQYQPLFQKIGYLYGGSVNNFNIPNLVGRTVFGRDGMEASSAGRVTVSGSNTLGAIAGLSQHTLTQAQTPLLSHTHTVTGAFSVPTGANRYGNNSDRNTGKPRRDFNTNSGECSHSLPLSIQASSNPSGFSAAQPHPNLPPFVLLNWIIKI